MVNGEFVIENNLLTVYVVDTDSHSSQWTLLLLLSKRNFEPSNSVYPGDESEK